MEKPTSNTMLFQAKTVPLIFFILLSSFISQAQEISKSDKTWLAQQILAPATSINFQMNLSTSMLKINEIPADKQQNKLPNNLEELDLRLAENPLDAEASEKRFTILIQKGERQAAFEGLQKTLNLLLQALEAHPDSFDILSKANSIFFLAGDNKQVLKLTGLFIDNNPNHAEAKSFLAMQLALQGEFEESRKLIDAAYILNPKLEDVYMAEWSYQWTKTMVQLNQSIQMDLRDGFSFLEKAAADNPKLVAPQIAMHSLTLTRALIIAILNQQDDFIAQKAFTFKLDQTTQNQIALDKKYFHKALKKKPANPYFLQKCMTLILIMESKTDEADKWYQQSRKTPHTDTDIHRIMTIGRITEANFAKASQYVKEGFEVSETPESLLLYARLISDNGDPGAAATALENSNLTRNLGIELARISYLAKSGDWNAASQSLKPLQGGYNDDNETTFRYLTGILSLVSGDREAAKTYLYTIREDRHYATSVKEILTHFELK